MGAFTGLFDTAALEWARSEASVWLREAVTWPNHAEEHARRGHNGRAVFAACRANGGEGRNSNAAVRWIGFVIRG
jgi:hypothetical protein